MVNNMSDKAKNKTTKKPSSAQLVEALFVGLRAVGQNNDRAWLDALRQRADARGHLWKADAAAYIRGLAAGGAINKERADELQENLGRCPGVDHSGRDTLLATGWMLIVATAAMVGRAMAPDLITVGILAALSAAAGALWAHGRPWLDRLGNPGQSKWERPVVITASALFAPLLLACVASMSGLVSAGVSQWAFESQRTAFATEPDGFAFVQQVAKRDYGITLVLGEADQSWALTTIHGPNASSASMELRPGYCVLHFNRNTLLSQFGPDNRVDAQPWIKGIMMHELAHCLDRSRDMPTFGNQHVSSHSLPPQYAKGVTDLESFLQARNRHGAQLWAEAVADILAVGYWRKNEPAVAKDMIAHLRGKRAAAAMKDTSHATMCWIDQAALAAAPTPNVSLFDWADRLRSSAPCQIPHQPQERTGLAKWGAVLRCAVVWLQECD